jgi:predicted nucleic acid-binding Zn ribbon protein
VTRRRAPRQAASAFRAARARVAPQTPLAALQASWAEAVGPQLAAVSTPVAERAGEATIECADAVWTQELDLMRDQLLARLREHLGDSAPTGLRFRIANRS